MAHDSGLTNHEHLRILRPRRAEDAGGLYHAFNQNCVSETISEMVSTTSKSVGIPGVPASWCLCVKTVWPALSEDEAPKTTTGLNGDRFQSRSVRLETNLTPISSGTVCLSWGVSLQFAYGESNKIGMTSVQ